MSVSTGPVDQPAPPAGPPSSPARRLSFATAVRGDGRLLVPTVRWVGVDVIVLNGGSSAGKSSIARALQLLLPVPWLTFGEDVLGAALPQSGVNAVMTFGPHGEVEVAPGYRPLGEAWYRGLAVIATAGVGLVLDEIFLRGAAGQAQLAATLTGLDVLWVAVRCDPAVAAAREAARGDRVVGMAASQADLVHRGVTYDVEVDTTTTTATDCAQLILDHIRRGRRAVDHQDRCAASQRKQG